MLGLGLGQVLWLDLGFSDCLIEGAPNNLQGGPKIGTIFVRLNSTNFTDFQNYFTVRIRKKFAIRIPPHFNCVAALSCEISSVLKATIENNTTSVTTHFKKLTTGNSVLIVSVIVQSNCHILQFYITCSMCPSCFWTTNS